MNARRILEEARQLVAPFRVTNGRTFRLEDVDPGDMLGLKSEGKPRAKEALTAGIEALAHLQDMLSAQHKWALRLIFQARGVERDGSSTIRSQSDPPTHAYHGPW